MYLEFILIIILVRYLRKAMRKEGRIDIRRDRLLLGLLFVGVALLVVSEVFSKVKPFSVLLTDALLLWLVQFVITKKELGAGKSLAYAVLPSVIISIISELTRVISPKFFDDYDEYFDSAALFGFIWLFAFWLITRKQRKTLEEERQRAIQREKEYLLSEQMKAQLEVQVAERTADLTTQKEALEQALNELKSTQAQLIQSEKMASLGELTAGIAHEIQNPLNFVNNFSELNTELIAEMKQALNAGDLEEARAIADDITANEQKINHHGKRADGIVKGMLQHSRNSSGQKEPTDINALADEYLRLAYHGLRAKDKSFNASMKTDFDESIGKVLVVPQDLGRVILNLITNAFYAVALKKKELTAAGSTEAYDPTVTVTTRKTQHKLCITVKDNGDGVPAEVVDKIFQPFFTTKPTGEGTGLGLSMSYDIVTKMHGGELKLNTSPKQGSEFIIQLPLLAK